MIEKKLSPINAEYNCITPLNIALEVASNLKPLRSFRKHDYELKESQSRYIPYSEKQAGKGVYLHAIRVHKALLETLNGDISISGIGSKLKNGENIYVVTALKAGKACYLSGINADESEDAEFLAI